MTVPLLPPSHCVPTIAYSQTMGNTNLTVLNEIRLLETCNSHLKRKERTRKKDRHKEKNPITVLVKSGLSRISNPPFCISELYFNFTSQPTRVIPNPEFLQTKTTRKLLCWSLTEHASNQKLFLVTAQKNQLDSRQSPPNLICRPSNSLHFYHPSGDITLHHSPSFPTTS